MNQRSTRTYQMVVIALMAAITCIVGPFSVPLPFTLVPISLTNLVIYLCAYLLPAGACTMSYVLYLLIGLVGLPVFSGFTGGASKLAGPTGGYLIGFILTAACSSYIIHKFEQKIYMHIIGMAAGLFFAYLFGTIMFSIQQNMSFVASLSVCVVPFLVGDVLKITVAVLVGIPIRKRLHSAGYTLA